ncbi:MAG: hypothetical protein LBT19_02010 [Candidatus Nomurabacteria bacterium]|jgi:hypothetical protein|nr:hypothetical protein [Candidatus Nomurabacteria bacterium]
MGPINTADENELQKAINNITSDSAPDVAVAPEGATANSFETPAPTETPSISNISDPSSDSDLGKVKSMALSDLLPVLNEVDMPAESKFKIYKDIIEVTNDKASIEPAYTAAKAISSDKERAEALLYIIETIDKLG